MERTSEQVTGEVNFITQLIGFKPDSVIDVCCGVGDILAGFECAGANKTLGIEFSEDYVKNRYTDAVIQADACEKNTDDKFQLTMNWFSSFSYFDKVNNLKMLRNCFDVTEKVFVMEMFNSYNILMNFKDSVCYEKSLNEKKYNIIRRSKVEALDRKLNQIWTFSDGENSLSYETSVQLYFVDEIVSLLREVGFKQIDVFSRKNNDLLSFDILEPRIVFRATV